MVVCVYAHPISYSYIEWKRIKLSVDFFLLFEAVNIVHLIIEIRNIIKTQTKAWKGEKRGNRAKKQVISIKIGAPIIEK